MPNITKNLRLYRGKALTGNVQKLLLNKRVLSAIQKPKNPTDLRSCRKKVDTILDSRRKKIIRKRKPSIKKTLKRIEQRKSRIKLRLEQQMNASHRRTPNEVINEFIVLLSVASLRSNKRKVIAPARLIVRSSRLDEKACKKKVASVFGDGTFKSLKNLKISVEEIPLKKSKLKSFSICFPIEHYSVRSEILNLVWALRRITQPFESVTVSGLSGEFLNVDTSSALRAERSFSWHLDMTRVTRAHELDPQTNGKRLGEDIVIAHPDSGWASHSQYNENNIDKDRSHNVLSGQTGPGTATHSILNSGADAVNITHGTGTGSIILGGRSNDNKELSSTRTEASLEFSKTPGPRGLERRWYIGDRDIIDDSGHLPGVAPKATVLPIKFISDEQGGTGVFRLFDEDLIKAIRYAINEQVHVISLSVGGLLHDETRQILDEAVLDHNIIVVAAAGQTFVGNFVDKLGGTLSALSGDRAVNDSVVLPAAYQNVIAVAGCPPDGAPWRESHAGPNVDITAPADAIWNAGFAVDRDRPNSVRQEHLEAGAGTSFAASFMAGVAALWLSHWGRDYLIRRYGRTGVPLAWVFHHQLQRTANAAHVNNWDVERYGPGVVNVEALLNEPLPAPNSVEPPPAQVFGLIAGVSAVGEQVLGFLDCATDKGVAFAEAAQLLLAELQREALNTIADLAAETRAAIIGATGATLKKLQDISKELEAGLVDLVDDAEEFIEDRVDDLEEGWEQVEEIAEDIQDDVGEAAEDFIDWLFRR